MEDTLGLVDAAAAAAAVDSQRRDGALRWRCETANEAGHCGLGLEQVRSARAQQRAVEVEGKDIVNGCNGQARTKGLCRLEESISLDLTSAISL